MTQQYPPTAFIFRCEVCCASFIALGSATEGRAECPECGAHAIPQGGDSAGQQLLGVSFHRVQTTTTPPPGVARYTVRKREDGRWEATPRNGRTPLFVFDTEVDLAAFLRSVPPAS